MAQSIASQHGSSQSCKVFDKCLLIFLFQKGPRKRTEKKEALVYSSYAENGTPRLGTQRHLASLKATKPALLM